MQVNKKVKLNSGKVEQAPGNTDASLQPAPAVPGPLQSGSSILPAPHKVDKEKPKKEKKLGTASAPTAAGKAGSPTVHSKAVKPPKERSLADAHAGTKADVSEQGRTHEAAVGKREEDASALNSEVPEPATGELMEQTMSNITSLKDRPVMWLAECCLREAPSDTSQGLSQLPHP